ncbi:hypothetical protein [Ornithinibacillus halotolerans]|uniref:Uncharacterized protein n=1 Tax=Ornithinibacillus halotolerans TaxID=1274357 RepID=A0A916WEY7_9BACI|nr:hypothetical protein [Ornithinibacillus halotolerans]GGA91483.1 hypothetical protein GCM10008025_37520 [Ornithinibacillus halotolerans]
MGIPSNEVRKAYKEVEKKLLNKESVDVGDNIGYLIHFIKKRQSDFFRHLNPKQLEDELQPILNYESDDEYFYPHLEADSCIKDSYLAVEDYDTYWDLMYQRRMDNFSNKLQKIVMFDDIYSVYKKCRNPIIWWKRGAKKCRNPIIWWKRGAWGRFSRLFVIILYILILP